jgi:hypothetical protein
MRELFSASLKNSRKRRAGELRSTRAKTGAFLASVDTVHPSGVCRGIDEEITLRHQPWPIELTTDNHRLIGASPRQLRACLDKPDMPSHARRAWSAAVHRRNYRGSGKTLAQRLNVWLAKCTTGRTDAAMTGSMRGMETNITPVAGGGANTPWQRCDGCRSCQAQIRTRNDATVRLTACIQPGAS